MTATAELTTLTAPIRSCIGCRGRAPQSELVRHVAVIVGSTARIVRDDSRHMSGRGAYLHDDPDCLNRAMSKGAFRRALRIPAAIEAQLTTGEDAAQIHDSKGTSM